MNTTGNLPQRRWRRRGLGLPSTAGVGGSLLVLLLLLLIAPVTAWNLPLPGGGRVAYEQGLLRIRLEPKNDSMMPTMPPSDATIAPDVLASIEICDTGTVKGYGAYCTRPLSKHTFLGFYEGTQRSSLPPISSEDSNDYIMSLDGGATYLDGYQRAQDRTTFSPVHLNHADKDKPECNCLRILQNGQCAFFTARDIDKGEELSFDYGANYWRGRSQQKI